MAAAAPAHHHSNAVPRTLPSSSEGNKGYYSLSVPEKYQYPITLDLNSDDVDVDVVVGSTAGVPVAVGNSARSASFGVMRWYVSVVPPPEGCGESDVDALG